MKRAISIIIIFALLTPFVSAWNIFNKEEVFNETFVDNYINKIVNKINNNPLYLNFISNSDYDSVKVTVEDEAYYFHYNNSVSLVDEIDYDFAVKMSYNDFKKAAEAHKTNNKLMLKYIAFKILPFRVKLSLFFQCLGTDWCRGMMV